MAKPKMKTAVCERKVPACFCPTKTEIQVGEKLDYVKQIFRNGEHYLVLLDGKTIPSIFFKS